MVQFFCTLHYICKVYEIGEVQGSAYIAMQCLDGQSLDRAAAALTLTERVVIMRQVALAIREAHKLGIIHRDLKPANIMVERTEDGLLIPVIMDFGLARESDEGRGLTESGAVMGTPAYMAPEQARGETLSVDRRSDVYSLGATLYELIAGVPPFDAESVVELLLKVLDAEPRPLRQLVPSVSPDLETIVHQCLEKNPAARYDSAKALADDLGRFLDGEAVLARRISVAQRLYRRARKHKVLVALAAALVISLLGLIGNSVGARLATIERERRAQRQAELSQQLGQEIAKMEWLLRSARALPLHDLDREKRIVRDRMTQLQAKLLSDDELSRGLARYALGRGHLALREYPQALAQLQQAMQQGYRSADAHYALGLVLGKHFEQAMYEARLSGGGDWARKQLKEIEPRFLTPAIVSLQFSRSMQSDAPEYLEGLIAYYQRDYESALKHAEAALRTAPWLYEASKLAGDAHLERALQARDTGLYAEAQKEFAGAVRSYGEAAEVGRSDGEVFEGLAESWVRQIEMALNRGQSTEEAYRAAVAASDKLIIAEPQSIAGPLKKGYASLMTMGLLASGMSSTERVQQCLISATAVLEKQPGHPYASDLAAGCYTFSADGARAQGKDPEPLLRKALSLLEPAVVRFPQFLWGLNDLGSTYCLLGSHLQLHGDARATELLEKARMSIDQALALDPTYLTAINNQIWNLTFLIPMASTKSRIQSLLRRSDATFAQCMRVNSQFQQCHANDLAAYARAAQRVLLAGEDPQEYLQHAFKDLAEARRLGDSLLDVEQHAALAYFVDATARVRRHQDPHPALEQMQRSLTGCWAHVATDAMCQTLAAQADWVESSWLSVKGQPVGPALQHTVAKAMAATRSPEVYPDAWQVLAETYLRLARATSVRPTQRDQYVALGLGAVKHIFLINPNHALGQATQGALELLQAQTRREADPRRASAQLAVAALQQAIKNDPLLNHDYAPLLAQAEELVSPR